MNWSRVQIGKHISRMNCPEIAGYRPKQPAYNVFFIKIKTLNFTFLVLNPKLKKSSARYGSVKVRYPLQNALL